MTVLEIILSAKFLSALLVYTLLIIVIVPLQERVDAALDHPFLQWQWEHVAIPLSQAALLVVFILMAYPVIYGVQDAPAVTLLLAQEELRINYLINLVFIISLCFPLLPVIGGWFAFILPVQGIAAGMMIFSWLAAGLAVDTYSIWPGWDVIAQCAALAVATHWLALETAHRVGHTLDRTFNVTDSGELFARVLVLLLQSPVVLIYCAGLGRQLPPIPAN